MRTRLAAAAVGLAVLAGPLVAACTGPSKQQTCAQDIIEAVNSFDLGAPGAQERFDSASSSLRAECGDFEAELRSMLRGGLDRSDTDP